MALAAEDVSSGCLGFVINTQPGRAPVLLQHVGLGQAVGFLPSAPFSPSPLSSPLLERVGLPWPVSRPMAISWSLIPERAQALVRRSP